ncbi:MAG: acyl-CoA dehydrogenase [Desulfobacteraceae bacterium]|nr:acyl-CoA dehydrogenase [Desulfobacteraceae bacterium]
MMLLNPKEEKFENLDNKSREIMLKTIEFFEKRGKVKLKADYEAREWYSDFLEFVKKEKIFATLLTPTPYGNENKRWDTYRNCFFSEILGFYGLPYWYTWQVSILGLGPIWMGKNDKVKKRTAQLLDNGEIFAFGLSEKQHGADLYSSEMALTPLGNGKYVADGGKYYIGNANKAAIVSTFGKDSETDEYVFFAVDSQHENFELIQNVVHSQNYVAEYNLQSYPITDDDILSKGQEAWDSALNTINVGKFNLGWASIGICTHAFYEAINHASNRNLYGKMVTEFPHIRQLFVDAYARLTAMKLFALRNADYMRSASENDRRYLLYNPMTKMKVTTQGEEVINLLWDVIAAKGFEKDMYFESAAQDIRALPKLEGTVHVNMALIIKFMPNYFFSPDDFPVIEKRCDSANDDFLFNQGPTRGLGKIRFHDYNIAYNSINLPNISIFKEQIKAFKELLMAAPVTEDQQKDIDFLLILGELFTLVGYGQLIIENAIIHKINDALLDQIFDFMIRDFSKFALQLYSKPSSTDEQMTLSQKMIKKANVDSERFNFIWKTYVYPLNGIYEMNP